MKILDFVLFLILIAALVMGGYIFWQNLSLESVEYKPFVSNYSGVAAEKISSGTSNTIVQFYKNMRYRDKKISYELADICNDKRRSDIERTFGIISERTVLRFYSTDKNPEMSILCSDVSPKAEERGHFVAGEGGPSEIISTANYAVILSGKVALYRDDRCDEPKIALHEILHALGFDHYNNENSIMYPVTDCDQQIDNEIISKINQLYEDEPLPDLAINNIVANRTGRYLNFNINISNEGLADASGTNLDIFAEGKKVGNFTMGTLEIGSRSFLTVQNLRLPSGAERIEFSVEWAGKNELNLQNNNVELSVG